MAIGFLFVLMIVVATAGYAVVARAGIAARDIAWLADTSRPSAAAAAVYAAYLARHRRHRLAGGLAGALLALVVGIRYYRSVSVGVGHTSPLADVLFCGLAGVLIGALAAERFRLSEPQSTTMLASLADRGVAVEGRKIVAARALAAVAVLTGAAVAAVGRGPTVLCVAVAGAALAAVAEATRAAVLGRRRPVLSDEASEVDLRIRSFAYRSVAMLQLAAAVLVTGWVVAKLPGTVGGLAGALRVCLVLGCLAWTLVLLRRAAPRPPRRWMAPTLP